MNPSPPGSGASMEGTATAAKTASFAARRRPIAFELGKMMMTRKSGVDLLVGFVCCCCELVNIRRLLKKQQSKSKTSRRSEGLESEESGSGDTKS